MRRTTALLSAGLALFAQGAAAPALPTAAPPPGQFSDVPPDHWAYNAVNELAALGILKGYPAPPAAPRRRAARRGPAGRRTAAPSRPGAPDRSFVRRKPRRFSGRRVPGGAGWADTA